MLFNSLQFAIFFPVVTLPYFALPHRWRGTMLLGASRVFYMAFVPAYIGILAVTIVIDYVAGIRIERATGAHRKRWPILSIASAVRQPVRHLRRERAVAWRARWKFVVWGALHGAYLVGALVSAGARAWAPSVGPPMRARCSPS